MLHAQLLIKNGCCHERRSDRLEVEGLWVRDSLEALCCDLEQDTLSSAYSTGSTQEA